jgi:hypothetical protein
MPQGHMFWGRVREIEQQRIDRAAELRLLAGVDAFCTSVRGVMEDPAFAVQQQVVQLVVHRIVVEDSGVIIEHSVPTELVRLPPEHQPCETLR